MTTMQDKTTRTRQDPVEGHSYPPDKEAHSYPPDKEAHSYPPDKEAHSYPPDKGGKGGYIPYKYFKRS